MIRTFIAIDIPQEAREALAEIQEQLKKSRAGVRWVKLGSIHLTLKFLGDVHPAQIDDIAGVTAQVVRDERFLSLGLAGLGAFPSPRNPRVVWVGIRGEVERLTSIQERLQHNLVVLGFAPERRVFRPHLTLGRVKDKRNRQALIEAMAAMQLPEFNYFDVPEIILYKSDLRPTGAIYTKLHRMALAEPEPP
jgi:2'-5' RNA ligase